MISNTEVKVTRFFFKQLKQLYKKYPSIKNDLTELNEKLILNPRMGTPLGLNTFKIRVAINSKAKGKSGGARVVSFVETEILGVIEKNTISLLTIYDKSEIDSFSQVEIATLIRNISYTDSK